MKIRKRKLSFVSIEDTFFLSMNRSSISCVTTIKRIINVFSFLPSVLQFFKKRRETLLWHLLQVQLSFLDSSHPRTNQFLLHLQPQFYILSSKISEKYILREKRNQLHGQQSACLIVSFTACLTSLIFQQYRNGFKDELKKTKTSTIRELTINFDG